uniref:Uncharacterized protein n=1 Tax=Arundo donax TaxID=35708 RepID=A0A0A9AB70_ARUDO
MINGTISTRPVINHFLKLSTSPRDEIPIISWSIYLLSN